MTCKEIAEHYGIESQSRQLVEEMAELMVAMNKYIRAGDDKKYERREDVIEEVADVEIMLEQVKHLLNVSVKRLEIEKKLKLLRQTRRIEVENGR
jgi:NTP pyrophosphatase (non-canonical NTP hydrolase)